MSIDHYAEALERFSHLHKEALKTGISQPAAMVLATVDDAGRPSVRTMVIRRFDERGFVFFTSRRSRKAQQLAENPHAALCFFCQPLKEQVTIEGTVEQVDKAEADDWWRRRPRDSQFAAWASTQSAPIDALGTMKERLKETRARFGDQVVPRAPDWEGYRLVPERIEFWRTGWRHLHERVCYCKRTEGWAVELLQP